MSRSNCCADVPQGCVACAAIGGTVVAFMEDRENGVFPNLYRINTNDDNHEDLDDIVVHMPEL